MLSINWASKWKGFGYNYDIDLGVLTKVLFLRTEHCYLTKGSCVVN